MTGRRIKVEDGFIKVARPFVGDEEIEAVAAVLRSGAYASGKIVGKFEEKFAEYIGTKYAVAVNSGTAALHIALEALGIREGDEVIVPPLTFFATVSAVMYLRAIPVFADIDLDDFCLSPDIVESVITSKTKAIIPVHLFGNAAKTERFAKISEEFGIPVLEDCAQAHGTEINRRKAGSWGKAGAFSFFATKHMTTGEGGMITTDDPELAEAGKLIRNHGMSGRDDHVRLGFNNRMTEMEAAMGLVQLEKLDMLNEKRIQNSEYIIDRIQDLNWLRVLKPAENVKHTYFWCPLLVEKNSGKTVQALKKHLAENRIGFRHRYSEPLYKQKVLNAFGDMYSKVHLPNVEKVVGNVIGLPNHPGLARKDADRIIEAVRSFK